MEFHSFSGFFFSLLFFYKECVEFYFQISTIINLVKIIIIKFFLPSFIFLRFGNIFFIPPSFLKPRMVRRLHLKQQLSMDCFLSPHYCSLLFTFDASNCAGVEIPWAGKRNFLPRSGKLLPPMWFQMNKGERETSSYCPVERGGVCNFNLLLKQ